MDKLWESFVSLIDQNQLVRLLGKTLLSLLVLVAFLVLARLARGAVRRLTASTSTNANLPVLLGNLTYVTLLVVGGVAILSIYTEAGLSTVLTLLGLLSLAISLSVQDVLKNFVSGIYLLLEQPFSIGDRVRVRELEGKIENIEIRTTTIHTDDGVLIYIPNSIVFSEIVTNRTAFRQRLSTLWLTVPAGHSFENSRDQITNVMNEFGPALVSLDPAPLVLVEAVSAGAVTARLDFWSPISAIPNQTNSEIILALTQALPEVEFRTTATPPPVPVPPPVAVAPRQALG